MKWVCFFFRYIFDKDKLLLFLFKLLPDFYGRVSFKGVPTERRYVFIGDEIVKKFLYIYNIYIYGRIRSIPIDFFFMVPCRYP